MASYQHCGKHHHQYPVGDECPFCVVETDEPEPDDQDEESEAQPD